jgi:Flp pilus assembly protein TadG
MDSLITHRAPAGTRRRFLRSERGAELVEFALVLPLLLLLIGGIADFAFLFHSMEVTTNAAREGARLGTLPGYDASDWAPVKARVTEYLEAGGLKGTHVTQVSNVSIPLGGSLTTQGVEVRVTYTYDYWLIEPIAAMLSQNFATMNTYTVVSRMRKELQATSPTP